LYFSGLSLRRGTSERLSSYSDQQVGKTKITKIEYARMEEEMMMMMMMEITMKILKRTVSSKHKWLISNSEITMTIDYTSEYQCIKILDHGNENLGKSNPKTCSNVTYVKIKK